MLRKVGKTAAVLGAVGLLATSFWYGGRVSRRYEERIVIAYGEAKEDAAALVDRAKGFLEKELDLRVSTER